MTWVFEDFFPIDTSFYVKTELPMAYVYFALCKMGLADMNTDSAVPGLNRNNALSQNIHVPGERELGKFTAEAGGYLQAIRGLRDEITDLIRTRDELLPLLMSGKVRVEDVEIPKGAA